MKFKRVLLKLSGEALMGDQHYGIDPERIEQYAQEIKKDFESYLIKFGQRLKHVTPRKSL